MSRYIDADALKEWIDEYVSVFKKSDNKDIKGYIEHQPTIEPKICDTCRYYNSNIPCGTTPSACKEADKFAEEFVDGLKKLKQTEPTISKMEQVEDEPQTETQTETQNSNFTFEKDECAKEYEELGLKELKELINADRKTENSSEIPNNCEHITEDGVTCAKYPACDDCLDNPLNKVKGSERLVKGSEQTDLVEDSPSLVKDLVKAFGEDGTWLERQGVYTLTLAEAKQRAVDIIESVLAKDEPTISKMEQVDKDINVRSKDEPQRDCFLCKWLGDVDVCGRCRNRNLFAEADTEPKPKDEPQTCSFSDCDNFKNPDYARCIECKRKQIESKTEPQTERNNYHRSRKVCTLELFDDDGNYIEPQTDCAWK